MLHFMSVLCQNEVKDDKTFYVAKSHELKKCFFNYIFLFILFLFSKFQK